LKQQHVALRFRVAFHGEAFEKAECTRDMLRRISEAAEFEAKRKAG
jgi:hypothetical protein